MGDEEVDFLLADKHKSFLQDGNITFSVISQTGTKYEKQSLYDIFAISEGKYEWRSWFLPAGNCERFFQIAIIILGVCDQACPNYLK